MIQILLNKQGQIFQLNSTVIREYAKLLGKTVYIYNIKQHPERLEFFLEEVKENENDNFVTIVSMDKLKTPLLYKNYNIANINQFEDLSLVARNDPVLITAFKNVKHLVPYLAGIVEIPDEKKDRWYVDETDDGSEYVSEMHETWSLKNK